MAGAETAFKYKIFSSTDRTITALLRSIPALLASSTFGVSATLRYSDLRRRADASNTPVAVNQSIINQTTGSKKQYTHHKLAGYGFVLSH